MIDVSELVAEESRIESSNTPSMLCHEDLRPTTTVEMEQVAQFRSHPVFIDLTRTYNHSVVTRAACVDDRLIVRYIRARMGDVAKAVEMLKSTLEWREAFGTDKAFSWTFPHMDEFKSVYPAGYHKFDRLGRPIYIERVGCINVNRVEELMDIEELTRLHVQAMEFARCSIFPAASDRCGQPIDQQITIIDLAGLSMKQVTPAVFKMLSVIAEIDQNHYPELLSRMLIVNAPWSFSAVWAIVKPFLHRRTQKKIEIISKRTNEILLDLIDEDSLPDFLGGKDVTFLQSELEIDLRQCALGIRPKGYIAELQRFGFDPAHYPIDSVENVNPNLH